MNNNANILCPAKKIKKQTNNSKEKDLKTKLKRFAKNEPIGFRTFFQRKLCEIYHVTDIFANWRSIVRFLLKFNLSEEKINEILTTCRMEMMELQFKNQINQINNYDSFVFSEEEVDIKI